MSKYQKQSVILFVIVLAFQAFSLFKIVSRGNHDFISNIIGATVFWLVYTIIELIKKLDISLFVRAIAALAIVSDGFLGFYLNLYTLSPLYDRIQHIFGTYALALFFYIVITRLFRYTERLKWLRFFFIFSIGLAVGGFYEILEYLSDTLMNLQIPNQPSLEDTDLDLISDFIGAFIAGIHSLYTDFGPKRNKI